MGTTTIRVVESEEGAPVLGETGVEPDGRFVFHRSKLNNKVDPALGQESLGFFRMGTRLGCLCSCWRCRRAGVRKGCWPVAEVRSEARMATAPLQQVAA